MFNANWGLGRTVSRSQTGMLISWHRGALVEQLNEMFSLQLGAEKQASWRAEKLKTRRKSLQGLDMDYTKHNGRTCIGEACELIGRQGS